MSRNDREHRIKALKDAIETEKHFIVLRKTYQRASFQSIIHWRRELRQLLRDTHAEAA